MAKKEGRLLTKKQKEEQRTAELRKQALLASGVQIEGLQQQASGRTAKKVVYGSRKKKAPASSTGSGPATREPSPSRDATPPPEVKPSEEPAQDDWEASSGEEPPKPTEDVKDSWDNSSEDEAPKVPKPTQACMLLLLFLFFYANIGWLKQMVGQRMHPKKYPPLQSLPRRNPRHPPKLLLPHQKLSPGVRPSQNQRSQSQNQSQNQSRILRTRTRTQTMNRQN